MQGTAAADGDTAHLGADANVVRLAAGLSAARYPLTIHGKLLWRAVQNSRESEQHPVAELPRRFQATVRIANLQAGELVLPSLALPGCERYIVGTSLTALGTSWTLAEIDSRQVPGQPVTKSAGRHTDANPAVTTHIDVFAIHRPIKDALLTVELACPVTPENYLFVLSRRQQSLPAAPPEHSRETACVPVLSQMMQPTRQHRGTCSPTSLSMLMGYYGHEYHPAFVDRCQHTATGLYGVWPLNIAQTARRGFVAATELISHWAELRDHTGPIITSVRFSKGELSGSPLEQTPGHLVVACGTDCEQVFCNDPAAATAGEVRRKYDAAQFSRAWLGHRGATYIAVPLIDTAGTAGQTHPESA